MRTLSVVLFAMVAATASAAPAPDLIVRKVSQPPKRVAAGDDFLVKAKIKNVGDSRRGGRATMHLVGGTGDYALPRRIGNFKVARVAPGLFRRYVVRLTMPGDQGRGRYRLRTCVKPTGQARSCTTSRRLRVTP